MPLAGSLSLSRPYPLALPWLGPCRALPGAWRRIRHLTWCRALPGARRRIRHLTRRASAASRARRHGTRPSPNAPTGRATAFPAEPGPECRPTRAAQPGGAASPGYAAAGRTAWSVPECPGSGLPARAHCSRVGPRKAGRRRRCRHGTERSRGDRERRAVAGPGRALHRRLQTRPPWRQPADPPSPIPAGASREREGGDAANEGRPESTTRRIYTSAAQEAAANTATVAAPGVLGTIVG